MGAPKRRLTRLQAEVRPANPLLGLVRVDPPEEIFANKLCTLLGRAEIRDLVDVRALEGLGLSLTEGLAAGQRKDGGLIPAQLAWVLSEITIGDEAPLPGGVAPADLRDYLRSSSTGWGVSLIPSRAPPASRPTTAAAPARGRRGWRREPARSSPPRPRASTRPQPWRR